MSRRVVACGELKAIMAEGVGKPSLNRATSRTRQTRNRVIYPWPGVDHPVSGLPRATGRPIQTRFPYAFGHDGLQLATRDNSPAHSSIGMPSGIPILADRHSPPTGCGHTVSDSISLPSRGSFHLSLTVLVHYRSPRVFSLGRWSSQFPTGFHVSSSTQNATQEVLAVLPTGLSPCIACRSRAVRLHRGLLTSRPVRSPAR